LILGLGALTLGPWAPTRGASMSSTDLPPVADEASGAARGDPPMPGDLVYEYTPQVTQIVEYGIPAETVLMRTAPPPPEGARLDLHLEGPVIAGRLQGTVSGIDYLNMRADGRAELHIHAHIALADGKKVALEAGGLAIPKGGSSVFQLREHVKLTSNHPALAWVNSTEVWARGKVDVSTGQVHLRAYAV
jgi:Protein of unknown function (DUF3237)